MASAAFSAGTYRLFYPGAGGSHGHGQHPCHRPQRPGEAQLSQEGGSRGGDRHIPLGRQKAQQDRQIIHRPRLSEGGGGQIHRDPGHGEAAAAALDGGTDPLPGLLYRRVRQAHHVKGGKPAADGALHLHLVARDALEPQGPYRYHP